MIEKSGLSLLGACQGKLLSFSSSIIILGGFEAGRSSPAVAFLSAAFWDASRMLKGFEPTSSAQWFISEAAGIPMLAGIDQLCIRRD